MVKRRVSFSRVGPLPTSGRVTLIVGDNPRRVGLYIRMEQSPGEVRLYEKDRDVNFTQGFSLNKAEFVADLAFTEKNGCPQNAIFGGATIGSLFVCVAEVTDEDIG